MRVKIGGVAVLLVAVGMMAGLRAAEPAGAGGKAQAELEVVPLPHDQAAFVRGDGEIARFHFGPDGRRPFIYPVIGPSGRPLTRMGHPHDPLTHSHHNSVWVSHEKVNGISFWGDRGRGKIVHRGIVELEDRGRESWIVSKAAWVDEGSGEALLGETRRTAVRLLEGGEWMLIVDLRLEAPAAQKEVMLGKSAFGLIGVRMAKSIGVNDGGGEIRNSAGAEGEEAIFHKPAKWVDYSGPVRKEVVEGITLMDHPENPGYPSAFHVRADGWMGVCLTLDEERRITVQRPLRVRYGLYIHAGKPAIAALEKRWVEFAGEALMNLAPQKKGSGR